MKRRMLSLLLTLIMVVGLFPATMITASAATTVTEVDTWEELKSALTASGTATIKLTDDIKKTIELKENDGPAYKINYEDPQITVCGTKTLDLNGYTITVDDQSNAWKGSGGDGRRQAHTAETRLRHRERGAVLGYVRQDLRLRGR